MSRILHCKYTNSICTGDNFDAERIDMEGLLPELTCVDIILGVIYVFTCTVKSFSKYGPCWEYVSEFRVELTSSAMGFSIQPRPILVKHE